MKDYETKERELLGRMDALAEEDMVIAFSGGVDSSLLVKLACLYALPRNKKVYAVTISSELQPAKDAQIAARVAAEAGAVHELIHTHELEVSGIDSNSKERCYLCKKYLFTRLLDFAAEHDIRNVIEGTNEDDLHVYRPGIRAIRELGILSPLTDAGFTKAEVRQMAGKYGISVAMRPSSPCLATRFPYGTHLTPQLLRRAELGENYLRDLGFKNVRLRVHGDIARIEVDKADIGRLVENQTDMIRMLKSLGYKYVTVDLEGFRSGSMDE